MMLLEPQEEIDDALWLLTMTDRLLRCYENGTRWPSGDYCGSDTTSFSEQWEAQLASERRPTPTATVTMAAILLHGYCEDNTRYSVPWKEVRARIEAVRNDMKQHIYEQGKRLGPKIVEEPSA